MTLRARRAMPFGCLCLVLCLGIGWVAGQSAFDHRTPLQSAAGVSLSNLQLARQNADGTEAILTVEYTYDGTGGASSSLTVAIEKKDRKGVSAWFGADTVTLGVGHGIVSVSVKFFNDERGVPSQFTTDRVRALLLSSSGRSILLNRPFLRTIHWGKAKADGRDEPPAVSAPLGEVMNAEKARKLTEDEAARRTAELAAAEAESHKLAEEKRLAQAKAEAEAAEREQALLKAQAEAKLIAEQKKAAEAKAHEEAVAQEAARIQAEREEKARKEAELKARAEAEARETARQKAQQELEELAAAKKRAEEKARAEKDAQEKARLDAEAKAREEARVRLEAQAKELARKKEIEEAKAQAEAQAREKAKQQAEAEAKAHEEALAKAKAEAEAREIARVKAETRARQLMEESRLAKQKSEAEAAAREAARMHAEEAARRLAVEQKRAAESARDTVEAAALKTRIHSVDVVKRSLDRSQMTFGVEVEYLDKLKAPQLGIGVACAANPQIGQYFSCQPVDLDRSRRTVIMLPVVFQPSVSSTNRSGGITSDQLMIYLQETGSPKKLVLLTYAKQLVWNPPTDGKSTGASQ